MTHSAVILLNEQSNPLELKFKSVSLESSFHKCHGISVCFLVAQI